MNLDELQKDVQECSKCGLAQHRKNIVFGEGNPRAKIMLIGEGPGAEEDRQGVPFVGAAGKLLDKILQAIDLTRQDVFIGNVVKCRPPSNRIPSRKEAEACLPWLYKQIEIISPEIIVLLGNTALQNIIDQKARITRARGKWFRSKSGIKIMPTYHPAALLRDPNKKRPVWEDFQLIRDEYRKLL